MLFQDFLVILRGGGDLATGVAYRLHQAGFPQVIFELAQPLAIRRKVAFATAIHQKEITIEGIQGLHVATFEEAVALARTGSIPVLVAPELPLELDRLRSDSSPSNLILVDARMAKRNIDTRPDQANLVICLGPGFSAGVDCHAVVETKRGHTLGRVRWHGSTLPDSGIPGEIGGRSHLRVLRAPASGQVHWQQAIGDQVKEGQLIGKVNEVPVEAPFQGIIRGLIAPGMEVVTGVKIGDIDPRADRQACFTISDKALAIGGGVIEAILIWLNRSDSWEPATRGR
jgi:xanthine dehydrogenase accessory factor